MGAMASLDRNVTSWVDSGWDHLRRRQCQRAPRELSAHQELAQFKAVGGSGAGIHSATIENRLTSGPGPLLRDFVEGENLSANRRQGVTDPATIIKNAVAAGRR
jgi:hypothetical protein